MQQRYPATPPGARRQRVNPAVTSHGRLAAPDSRLPPRTTKVSQKLVLLPETERGEVRQEEEEEDENEEEVEEEEREETEEQGGGKTVHQQHTRKGRGDFDMDNNTTPLLAQEEILRRRRIDPERTKSYAERLPKARRAEKVARVTAYCTAQAYKMASVASFVKEWHGGRMKLYDDCLYTAYQLPFLPGHEGYRLRSSPTVRYPGGKSLLDEEIERNELSDHHEEYLAEALEHSVGRRRAGEADGNNPPKDDASSNNAETQGQRPVPSKYLSVAEMFVFSYGVVVFWNFTEHQEKDLLADLAFATSSVTGTPVLLATLPLHEEDFETEEFHFEYSTEIARPRVYNDMITLRSGDHMIKLAISHGIAQSTKLCFFEEVMARQMAEAKDVPRRLATTGKLGMKREEVFRILGRLFKSRVEVNLSSNVLDVPNFFWESEPTLYPLYSAVREYLEIKPRVQVLNERCRVFLDLTEILSDSISDNKTSSKDFFFFFFFFFLRKR